MTDRTRVMLTAELPADHKPFVWATETTPRPEFVSRTLPADWRPDPIDHDKEHMGRSIEDLIAVPCIPCARRTLAGMGRAAKTSHQYRAYLRMRETHKDVLR